MSTPKQKLRPSLGELPSQLTIAWDNWLFLFVYRTRRKQPTGELGELNLLNCKLLLQTTCCVSVSPQNVLDSSRVSVGPTRVSG